MTGSKVFRSLAALALAGMAASGTVSAQEVVQPLPPRGAQQLGEALGRLARNADDLDALLDAGEAALSLGDIDAAIGFFGRARQKAPSSGRVALGLARAHTAARRPVEALRFFAEAERAGVDLAAMAAERGLAYDLIGDAASAQTLYRLVLARGANPEVTRQLALSQAIAGDGKAFEATLLPLLQDQDLAAFRTRAFGLAILGDTKGAIKIARDMMPAPMASRIEPYLRYMTKLTPAQQAAAGNLGIFPSSGAMGRDTPAIAAARAAPARPASTGSASTFSPASAPAAVTRPTSPAPAVTTVAARPALTTPPGSTQPSGIRTTASPDSRLAPAGPPMGPPAAAASAARPLTVASGAPSPSALPASRPATLVQSSPPLAPTTSPTPPPSARQVADEDISVAEAFASFGQGPVPKPVATQGAVDITRIEVPRERKPAPPPPAKAAPPPPAKAVPAPPKVPSRIWVQVATGKDRSALKFDWRRIARKADGALEAKGPFVTKWGEANRLLAGPYPSAAAARDAVKKLKEMGLDAFTFTSATGEVIDPLN